MNKNSGITLVALVVTIIVLLILAAVSINLVLGENGIITRARESKEKTEIATQEEKESLANLEDEVEKQVENDPTEMHILVNSGDDGEVTIPIIDFESNNYTIDWGDGTVIANDKKISKDIKIASIDGLKVADLSVDQKAFHKYNELNKEYVVKIKGYVYGINSHCCYNSENEKIIKILQWGELGINRIILEDCVNLVEIASPTKKSFENVRTFDIMFRNCTSLTKIPKDLFDYCSKDILEDNAFHCTFYGCTSLTGEAIPIWNKGYNNIDENNGGRNCYNNCKKLNDYEAIPVVWKSVVE